MEKSEFGNVAVLMTCYNRKDKTLLFLDSLYSQPEFANLKADIYLLDDGSTDGTAHAVKEKHKSVNVITGNGNLFWAGGMRKIWKHAMARKEYDIFLLFNDDVELFENSISSLINTYLKVKKNGTILVGSTLSKLSNKLSYGGHALFKINKPSYYQIKPHDTEPIPCHLCNANILLVDKMTLASVGLFSDTFTHYLADFDYSLRAFKNSINVLVAPGYYGYCEDDHGANWLSGNKPLKERINYLYHVKGLAYSEYLFYIKRHFPTSYLSAWLKLWVKTIFPIIWDKFKKI